MKRRVPLFLAALTMCLGFAGCKPAPPGYVALREQEFASWKKRSLEGTVSGTEVWECALCPKVRAYRSGDLWVGSADWDPNRRPNEPKMSVLEIPDDYALGAYEVTRGEYEAFVSATNREITGGCLTDRLEPGKWVEDAKASFRDPGFPQDENHPAVCVSWQDAQDYVAWLNTQTTGGYRLPDEAEWRFGTFGGGYEFYTWGETAEGACHYANALDRSAASLHPRPGALNCTDGAIATAPVGSYLPSALYSYDAIGNAAEWTANCEEKPAAPDTSCARAIVRGGSWRSSGLELRLARRTAFATDVRDNTIGFRVAKTVGSREASLPDASAYLARGRRMLDQMQLERALSDLDKAVELDPRNAFALAARGWTYFRMMKNDEAKKEFSAALALGASNASAIAGLGSIALMKGDPKEAIRQLDKALTLEPNYQVALANRAFANTAAENFEQGLADTARALELSPSDLQMLELRVSIRAARGEWKQAVADVDELVRVLPTLALAQGKAAAAYSMLLQDRAAMRAANRALRSDRTADNLVQRADVRPWSDAPGRRSDIEAALELDPVSIRALMALGELEARLGNHEAARDAFTRVLEQNANEYLRGRTLSLRGIEFLKLKDVNAANKDFEAYLQPETNAMNFNNLCWEMMIANVALSRAAGYCDRAVALKPEASNYLDSKATLLLRQGEWDKAIKIYDEALKLEPKNAHSLYGRGVASQERCHCETGIADMQKALNLRSDVQRSYERMGFEARYPATSVLPESPEP